MMPADSYSKRPSRNLARCDHTSTFGTAMTHAPPGRRSATERRHQLGGIAQVLEHVGEEHGVVLPRAGVRGRPALEVRDPAPLDVRARDRPPPRSEPRDAVDPRAGMRRAQQRGVVPAAAAHVEHDARVRVEQIQQRRGSPRWRRSCARRSLAGSAVPHPTAASCPRDRSPPRRVGAQRRSHREASVRRQQPARGQRQQRRLRAQERQDVDGRSAASPPSAQRTA